MHFAAPLPWWLAALVALAIALVAFLSYRRPLAPLTIRQRVVLGGLRALALAAAVILLCRPFVYRPPALEGDEVVLPVLLDVSRSMRVADAEGQTRIARAVSLVADELLPSLAERYRVEVLAFGETVTPTSVDQMKPEARQTDISGALAAARDRYRGRRVAGVLLVSDGGDTGQQVRRAASIDQSGPRVFAIGVGSPDGVPDREVLEITAGDPRLDQTSVDLRVTAVSRGYGRAPFDIRLLANGRVLETRRITPAADGSPVEEVFTISPDPLTATVYTAAVDGDDHDIITENNLRGVLVNPIGRKRRVLALYGAPAYEHSFITRALALDPGLEIDFVVRKGRDETGQNTFLVQAGPARAASLATGFPASPELLYVYDAVIIANVEADFFNNAQLELTADFVSERGGGLLVLGGRSFAQRGMVGTPLEAVLPLELGDQRGGGLSAAAVEVDGAVPHNGVALTPEGETHPVMRIGPSIADSVRLWSALPALAETAPLGVPRPGAAVLAVTAGPSGALHPLVAVQRYGRGRSMVFTGEASWRWRMMQPADDRTHEYFWRQAVRWLAVPAPDQVSVTVPDAVEPGDAIDIGVDVRDAKFAPADGATVDATVSAPGGDAQPITLRPEAGARGRFVAAFRPTEEGLYRVRAEARDEDEALGSATRWFYVGGSDREFADPRLDEAFLRRVASESGGQYVRAAGAQEVLSWLESTVPQTVEPEIEDLWHRPWAFMIIVLLLASEWILRRRWGLR
jgi:uncharacterized membrane protein